MREKNFRDYLVFYLGITTGLRISDLLNLKVYEVKDKTHIYLREKKTSKEKYIKIVSGIKRDLNEYLKFKNNNGYVFTGRSSTYKLSRVRVYQILKHIERKFKLNNIGTHTLRKTFGYHFYKQYKDLATLMIIFNHSSESVTLRYIGMSQDMIDNRLDNFKLGR